MRLVFVFAICSVLFTFTNCSRTGNTAKKIALGRQLFFDNRLSLNYTRSCATCHNPEFAFTDSYRKSTGIYGDDMQRNSRPLFNLQQQTHFTAADSTVRSLAMQMRKPLFHQHPKEMGLTDALLVQRVAAVENYNSQLKAIFSEAVQPVSVDNIINVIAAYVASIKSKQSKYDLVQMDKASFSVEEAKGHQLFLKLQCNTCHGGSNFDRPIINEFYFNTGLYNTAERYSYPAADLGLYELTKNPIDVGKFKVPTLRNLVFTAPYYHDGSAASLLQVLEDYNRGGRLISEGANKGNGALHKNKHVAIRPLHLNDEDKRHLLQFLLSLTDSTIKHK